MFAPMAYGASWSLPSVFCVQDEGVARLTPYYYALENHRLMKFSV